MIYDIQGEPLISEQTALENIVVPLRLVEINYQSGLLVASTTQCGSNMFEIGERAVVKCNNPSIVYKVCLYNDNSEFVGVYGNADTWLSGENEIVGKYARLKVKYSNDASCVGKVDEIQRSITITRYMSGESSLKSASISAIPLADSMAIQFQDAKFMTMCATKTRYADNKMPVTVGWLYRTNTEPYKFYYSSGVPDRLEYLFTWDKAATYNGNADPHNFAIGISAEGDIICVPRGELLLARYNPTVYPHTDYENPVVVDFGNDTKPTGWLQNDGFYAGDSGYVCLGEYTRPQLLTTNIWKVSAPYTQKENWSIKNTFTLSGKSMLGMKHTHNVDKDPFTGIFYSSTGDDDDGAKFLYSNDNGNTWTVFLENSEKYCRQLNFIWTKDYIYWATDSALQNAHCLFRASRNSNGLLDVQNIETLYTFPNIGAATYHICYIAEPEGFLLLNRYDDYDKRPLDIYFWDLKTGKMQIIGTMASLTSERSRGEMVGFRCDAVNHYPYYSDDKVVCGFGLSPNNMAIYNNIFVQDDRRFGYITSEASIANSVNNIVIEVV